MPKYITPEIDTEPTDLLQVIYDYLQAQISGWEPAVGNLDVWLAEAFAEVAADTRDLASQVPESIFRYFGASLVGLPPIDATSATTSSTWTAKDTAGYNIPDGTQVGIRNPSDELIPFEVVGDYAIPNGIIGTGAGEVQLRALNPGADGSGLGGIGSPVELIDLLEWVTTIVMTGATTGGVDDELDDDYLNRLRTRLTMLSAAPILPTDFALLASDIAGVFRAAAFDGLNPFHNWLTLNDASFETDVAGWSTGVLVNSSVSRVTTQFLDGIASMQMSSGAAGTMSVTQPTSKATTVSPGEPWVAQAWFKAATAGRTCRVDINWYSDTGASVLISTTNGTGVADTTGGWIQALNSAVAPAGAIRARLTLTVLSTGAGAENHFIDKVSMRRGTTTDWVPGGTAELNNDRMVAVAAVDDAGTAVSGSVKTNIDTYLQSLREVNFVVNVIDPVYATIDVTVTVRAATGYTTTDVQAAVVEAVNEYLAPSIWGVPEDGTPKDWKLENTVRYLALAERIQQVQGVAYITTTSSLFDLTMRLAGGTMGRIDVTLPGPIPLTLPGTVTVTVLPAA